MTIEERPIQDSLQVETALCPSENLGQNQSIRTTLLEDGKIVAAAPSQAKTALRALTVEWGLHISGLTGQNLLDHAKALDSALRIVYTGQEPGLTTALHRMHLLLLRQDRFFIAHLGASDVYLIRDRKVHPLALAPNLRKLEESLGFEFEAAGKLEPERVTCGSFSWPELPAMNMISSGYKPGDYLLFTSPGLFEQRDWPGILGSIARSGAPFDQAAVRLSRVGQARLRSEADGYLLVHIGGGEGKSVESQPLTADDSQTVRVPPVARREDAGHVHLRHQLELPTSLAEQRAGNPIVGIGAALAAILLLGAVFLAPYFKNANSNNGNKPTRTPRAGIVSGSKIEAGTPNDAQTPSSRNEMVAALPSRVPDPVATAEPAPPEVEPTAEAIEPTAVPPGPTPVEVLTQDTSEQNDEAASGRELARSGKLEQSSVFFRELVGERKKSFTIQVGVVTKPETVRRYFQNATNGLKLMLFQAKDRSYLTIGLYDSQKDAWNAVQSLPEFFRKQNAVVKPIGQILDELPPMKAKPTPKPTRKPKPTPKN